ncbi:phospho-sugar mutase [Kocuria sp.]|uniref:phospho-sugar mutase n=1 Tax=Kocuria sp. TaxID=1871328 RepID=UPI0026E0999B|nr:phospho-sugar mutase [Kocuria sp.]MDO5619101.1 phospho-sugar mutase [Kocuria sp.]
MNPEPSPKSSQQSASGPELLEAVRAWIAQDPDAETRRELQKLLDTTTDASAGEKAAIAAVTDLTERFSGTLQFGTAGLRAELGAGPMRMNRVVVQRAAAGVAAHVLEVAGGDADHAPRAVIGFDARKNSEIFARDTAAIFTAAGLDTLIMPRPLPTPVLAWAVREYNAEVGVMVTASHNPAADNGYKIYLGGRAVEETGRGSQIVPPHDTQIAAQIAAVGDARDIPMAQDGWTVLPYLVESHYLDAIVPGGTGGSRDTAATPAQGQTETTPRIVLTAMHGVGGPTAVEALARAGFTDVHPVREQHTADPSFPTVAFPNPEEPGALDLALATAREVGADLVIANDPDADRCAVAIPDADHPAATDGWRMLRGDEVGALLGLVALREHAGKPGAVVANSIVSSRLLGRMAAAAGVEHRETLTGFKWIARVPGIVYGYEEALGYCVQPETVRDKDGISAAVEVARRAHQSAARGGSLPDELSQLAVQHGLFSTGQLSIRVADLAMIPAMMATLREHTPTDLAGSPVVEVRDLANPPADSPLPPTDGLLLLTEDDTRVIVRPSGTEPKLKCYLEAVTEVDDVVNLPAARAAGGKRLEAVVAQLKDLLGE